MNKDSEITKGDMFYEFTFIKESTPRYAKNGNKRRYGIFTCSCGFVKEIRIHSVTSGITKSCGCVSKKELSLRTTQMNTTHGLSKSRLYKIWRGIKERCLNENCKRYQDYGGRGITICSEWINDFMSFYSWSLNNGYSKALEIDRINNNKGYAPSNCRYVTTKSNCNNTRRNIIVSYLNKQMTLSQACESAGVIDRYRSIWGMVKSGKTFTESIKHYV